MKTAVVYYSMSGNTKLIAEKIAGDLNADLIEIFPENSYPDKGFRKYFWGGKSAVMGDKPKLMPYEFSADKYDTIVFGTPVWAATFTPPIRTFIEENKAELSDKDIAVFMCQSGSGADKAISKLIKLLERDTLKAQLILVDPKDKPNSENDSMIKEFCKALG